MAGKEHFVDKRGFAVVDVGNDCDIADFLHTLLD